MGRVGLPEHEGNGLRVSPAPKPGPASTAPAARTKQRRVPAPTEVVTSPELIAPASEPAEGPEGGKSAQAPTPQAAWQSAAEAQLRGLQALGRDQLLPWLRDFYGRSEPALRGEERPLTYPILGASAALWALCILAGLALHAGAEPPHVVRQTRWLPLLGFDRWLRVAGLCLAAPALGLRYAAHVCSRQQRSGWVASFRDHHYGEAALLYLALALFRAAVYLLHATRVFWLSTYILLGARAGAAVDVMSDHFFLASCIAAVLTVEGCLAWVERGRNRRPPLRDALLLAAMAWAGGVYLLLCGDMLFTARYFHGRPETLWGAAAGLCFPAAAVAWMLYGVRGPGQPSVRS